MAHPSDALPRESSYDVIVVGGGGAGLAAAIEAAEAGASVVLLEKAAQLGGSTAWAIGSVTASQTPHQRAQGIVDDPAAHCADMAKFADAAGAAGRPDNDALRRVFCQAMPDTFQWLLDSGVCFFGPMPEPPHRVARMHNVLPNAGAFIYHLRRRALRAGVHIRLGTQVHSLMVEGGRVRAVLVHTGLAQATARGTLPPLRDDTEQAVASIVRARAAVILATGDFTNDPVLKARFMGPHEARVDGVNPGATGDGQRLAEALGASVLNGDLALGPQLRFIAPDKAKWLLRLPPWPWLAQGMHWAMAHLPDRLLRPMAMKFLTTMLAPTGKLFADGARLININGERFADEQHRPAWHLPEQRGKRAYILIDGPIARRYKAWPHYISTAPGLAYAFLDDYRRNRPDVYTEAPTLESLANRLGVKASALRRSAAASAGDARALTEGPFIALGPVRAVFVHADGGLAVDTQHRVLGADGRPIAGLLAAGATGQGGLLLKGHGHHLAWAFASGRRAGLKAARMTTYFETDAGAFADTEADGSMGGPGAAQRAA